MKTPIAPIKKKLSTRAAPAVGSLLVCATAMACSGTTAFKDTAAIRIATAAQLEPAPEPEAPIAQNQVSVRDNSVSLAEIVQFESNGARVLQDWVRQLQSVATALKENPHVKKVQIEGHASAEGSNAYNMTLSRARAAAVRAALIAQGVSARRLVTKAFGETQPVADNETESGRSQNRRVEFVILDQAPTRERIETDPTTGEVTVLETLND